MNKTIWGALGLAVIIVVGALAWSGGWFAGDPGKETVAVVNGDKITRSQLNLLINQYEGSPNIPARSQAEEWVMFERDLLDQLVGEYLLFQEAERRGYMISDEEVQEEISRIVDQFGGEDAFDQQLVELGISRDRLNEDIRRQMVTLQYFDQLAEENEIEASEEDLKAFFDEQVALMGGEADFTFEEAREYMKEQLEQERMGGILEELVAELRAEGEVDIRI